MSDVLLKVEALRTRLDGSAGVVRALDGVDFEIRRGETFAIVGESGCGKSEAILRGITQRYDDEGYFLARAIAPAQDITTGILRIRVIEGTITKFTPAGDYPYPKLLAKYAQPVLGEHPARLPTVERVLLLMSDLPGVTVKPRLKPLNAEAGEYELIADVDYRPVRAFGRLDNRGTPDVGRLQGWLGAGLNGVLGFGESINATFVTVPNQPKELLYGSLSGTLPVGHNGALRTWIPGDHAVLCLRRSGKGPQ